MFLWIYQVLLYLLSLHIIALSVNGCSLKFKGLNSTRNINNAKTKSYKFKEMEIFKTKWMDKLNESDFVPCKRLLSSEREDNFSTLVNLTTGRSKLPKLKISMPIAKDITNFSCVSPISKNKFALPLSPVNNKNRRKIPTMFSPPSSSKTLLNF